MSQDHDTKALSLIKEGFPTLEYCHSLQESLILNVILVVLHLGVRQELHHVEIEPAGGSSIPLADDPSGLEYLVEIPLPATGLGPFSLESLGMKALDALLGLKLTGNDQLDVRAGLALPEDHLISSVALTL